MPRFFCLTLLLIGTALPGWAQVVVTGRVTDAATGEPLPAATIQVEGTLSGTITNAEGVYEIRLPALPATLLVRFIGYRTARQIVGNPAPTRLDVALAPVAYELGELVVTGEDPAVNIMRKVIARKQAWRAALSTYRAEAYNRFTLRNDTGIVSIIESLTEVFWDDEKGLREVVKAKRQTSNLAFDDFLPAALFVANLYDDDVELAGYDLIGVTHPDALRHYDFTLLDRRRLDDQLVYDIAVAPKSRLGSAFVGRVAVLDSAYALLEAELRPGQAFLFPPPIEQFDVTYRQQFSNFGRDFWLPVDFRADIALTVNVFGLLAFPTFRIEQVSRLTDYAVNGPLPDSLYAGEDETLAVDSAAVAADTLLDRSGTAVPLTQQEQTAYAGIDSTMTLDKAYAPRGPLARFARASAEADDEEASVGASVGGLGLDLAPRLWFNWVEGGHFGLEAGRDVGERLRLTGWGGYSTALKGKDAAWSYGGAARLRLGADRRAFVAASYRAANDTQAESLLYPRFLASLPPLLGYDDYFDYYRNEEAEVRAGYRFEEAPVRIAVGYGAARHQSLAKHTDYDLLGRDPKFQTYLPAQPGPLNSLRVAFVLGEGDESYTTYGITGQTGLRLDVEHADPDLLGGDFDFTRYALRLDGRLPTFFRRRFLPNTLDVRLTASTFSGALPPQRFGLVETSLLLGAFTPYGALKTRIARPLRGEQHVAFYWEHNFRTVPFEVLGLYRAARAGHSLIVFGGHARTWLSVARQRAYVGRISLARDFHHEVGVSLSGLFGLLRLDLAWRLDAPGFSVGVAPARIF